MEEALFASNVLSIVACSWLIRTYFKLPEKTEGVKMILTLSISDLVFHTMWILTIILLLSLQGSSAVLDVSVLVEGTGIQTISQQIVANIMGTAFQFSLFWSSGIAWFAYKSFAGRDGTGPKGYPKKLLFFIILLAIFVTLGTLFNFPICTIVDGAGDCLLVNSIFMSCLPSILPPLFTIFYYVRCLLILKTYPETLKLKMKGMMTNLNRYAFVQLFTTAPLSIYGLVFVLISFGGGSIDVPAVGSILIILLGFTGFANALIFFLQLRNISNASILVKSGHETSLSISDTER